MKKSKKLNLIIMLSVLCFITNSIVAAASTVDDVLKPLEIIKTLFLTGTSMVGVIMLVKSLISIGSTIGQQDSAGLSHAIFSALGYFIIAAAPLVISLLGF